MSLSRDSRQERKLKALMRAQYALEQRFERIDWEEDTLYPEVVAFKAGKSVLGLPEGVAFDITGVVLDVTVKSDEDSDPTQK